MQPADTLSMRRGGAANLIVLYGATMLLSATLLFAVQPMFTKMVLPMLGGSPAVWNTAMMFFQMILLAGYAYAHLTSRFLTWRRQAILHVALLAIAFTALPIMPAAGWTPPTEGLHVFWLLGLFAVSIGLPFFVVSANAPLLQRWFAVSGHPSAADPYFLYGASNLGSIVALLAYPVAVQPLLGLNGQSIAWTAGYAALVVMIGLCALSIRRQAETQPTASTLGVCDAAFVRSPWRLRLQWIVFALVPSSLMLGVTTHISTDVAAVPLLWILPLTLYLLTFVIVFSRRPALKHEWMVAALPYLAILVVLNLLGIGKDWLYSLGLHLTAFFVCAMVCHGELVKRRPAAGNLTEFYLFMSVGGMLGGVFNALLAPVLFASIIEYPLALIAVCLLRPDGAAQRQWWKDLVLPALLFAALALPSMIPGFRGLELGTLGNFAFLVGLGIVVFSFKDHSVRFALGLAATMLGINAMTQHEDVLAHERSFFGVHRVHASAGGSMHLLLHGTTIHGAQYTDPAARRTHLTYYHRAGPFGQLFDAYAGRSQTGHVAVVGLGAGALACYRQPGQDWTFYEIDPVVVHMARDSGLFHYLADCASDSPIVMGDARLSIREAPANRYGIIFLDAFSSDAIPIHLLTREALQSYLGKLAENGIVVFHISNRYLELAPVIAALAQDAGLAGRMQHYKPALEMVRTRTSVPAQLVILSRHDSNLEPLDNSGQWQRLDTIPPSALWTDDFSNIVGALK